MLKKTLIASAIAAGTLASLGAQAQSTTPVRDNGFSYTYGQFGYDRWDYDNGPDVDVLTGEGAFALDEHLFLRGGLSFYDGDYDSPGSDDVDGNRVYVGAGFHTPLQRGLDLVGTADVIRDDNDFNDEEWGYALRAGLRHQTTDMLQLSGGAIYEDIYDGNFGVYGQGLVELNRAWDVGARVSFTDDSDNIGLFGRYNF
ncbi:MAG: hypothetical protein ABGX87_05335 [Alcanivorax sp.]|uniref:Outer membrane protein beta-barrel domain-containing protein n=1 Tax=Alloalcanivorax marinus TaxID=1177169 RepID=A0A9Q3YPI3_9GAMM|nr:hypothetical protein [Alloalcanivorax marinus]MBM7335274.1 hypothetical protein [Alloalcanivorax marinus]MCC4308865.1 hypothetical protein [Alloalcanivorax marinus]MCH2558915.1 hypothetical protein [Alcanivorax sp.]MCU5788172.1 hypothetical protein [Alloalcanivorax marinus]